MRDLRNAVDGVRPSDPLDRGPPGRGWNRSGPNPSRGRGIGREPTRPPWVELV